MVIIEIMEKRYLLSEAKAKFAEVIRAAKAGVKVVLVERTEPIFVLVRYTEDKTSNDLLNELRDVGMLTPSVTDLTRIKPIAKKEGALEQFLEDR